jgi:hypothetical protein
MTELFIQDAIVTAAAFVSACVVAWRVFSVVQPSKAPSCANCPSAASHGRKPAVGQPDASPQPMTLLRR